MLLVPSGHKPLPGFLLDRTLVLQGFQLYAVEKWLVSRDRPYPLLVVYTADSSHTVVLDLLAPTTPEVMKEAVHGMRLDARPKQTSFGTVMVTSLAHFRSDYTIVLVPEGDFRKAREQMHVNINLLRLGSAGRTALTLNHPSEATRERFCGTYLFPRQLAASKLNQTVLDLVRYIQTALCLFGHIVEKDGLLCDATLTALQTWAAEYHASERVPSPSVISALFSLIFLVRNRLSALHYLVPKDPFAGAPLLSAALSHTAHQYTALRTPATTPVVPLNSHHITPSLVDSLLIMPAPTELSPGAGSIIQTISDLQVFVTSLVGRAKDGQSLGGIVLGIGKRSREDDKDIGGLLKALWDGHDREDKGGSDDEEDVFSGLSAWNRRRVKDKLESWAGISNRRKKTAVILNNDDDDMLSSGQVSPVNTPGIPFAPPVIVTVSRDPSPTQLSPIAFNPHSFTSSSHINLSSPTSAISPLSMLPSTPNLPSTLRNRRPACSARVNSCSVLTPPSLEPEPSAQTRPKLSKRRSFPQYARKPVPAKILPLDHLRLDVALAGEALILMRRQAHVENVIRATAILNARLVDTSAKLRNVYSSLELGLDASHPGVGVGVLGELDSERARAGKMVQTVNTLWYEAEQFSLHDAWHVAVGGRRKVTEVRSTVFGTRAGHKTPVENDLTKKPRKKWKEEARQWRVGGGEASVDRYGRTESEAEEEEMFYLSIGRALQDVQDDDDDEFEDALDSGEATKDDDIEQPAPVPVAWRPVWLLKFFTSWGRRETRTIDTDSSSGASGSAAMSLETSK